MLSLSLFVRVAATGTLVSLFGFAALACGSSDNNGPIELPTANANAPGVVPTVTPPAYDYRQHLTKDPAVVAACGRYAAAELAYESTCTMAIASEKRAYYTDRYDLACLVAASEPNVNFGSDAIDACSKALGTWQAARCENRPHFAGLRNPLDVCNSFVAGSGKSGDACTADEQCASGTCATPLTITASVQNAEARSYTGCGTCAELVGAGASCTGLSAGPAPSGIEQVCAAGLACRSACEGTSCTSTCVAAPKEGGDCETDFVCDVGLSCRYMSIPQKFLCVVPKVTGAPCAEQNECNDDDVCHGGMCSPQSLAGEACRIDGATIPFDTGCIGSLECGPALTCVAPVIGPLEAPGAPCGQALVQVDDCSYNAPTCVASDKLLCPSAPQTEGGPCSNATDCDGYSICVDQICQPLTTGACQAGATVQ